MTLFWESGAQPQRRDPAIIPHINEMTCGLGYIDVPDDSLSALGLWAAVKCPAVRDHRGRRGTSLGRRPGARMETGAAFVHELALCRSTTSVCHIETVLFYV